MLLQPAISDCLFRDPLQDLCAAFLVDVGRGQVIQALVATMVVTVLDKSADLPFQVSAQEVGLQENADLHGLVPSLDFALGLRVMRRGADIILAFVFKIIGRLGRDVG